jgi:hypothetical protein
MVEPRRGVEFIDFISEEWTDSRLTKGSRTLPVIAANRSRRLMRPPSGRRREATGPPVGLAGKKTTAVVLLFLTLLRFPLFNTIPSSLPRPTSLYDISSSTFVRCLTLLAVPHLDD